MPASLLAAHFLEADLLYQAGAHDTASERLLAFARAVSDENARIGALGRLTEIACDAGDLTRAADLLSEMRSAQSNAGPALTEASRAELVFAGARYAYSRRNRIELQRGARSLLVAAERDGHDSRLWSLAARINSYNAVDRYHRRDPTGASDASRIAARALDSAPFAHPYVKTHVLTTRAVVDTLNPERVHLVIVENVEAFEIALRSGMVSTAYDALFNIVAFWLDCDEARSSDYGSQVAREILNGLAGGLPDAGDPSLSALVLAAYGRFEDAVERIDEGGRASAQESSEWLPIFFGPVIATKRARMLFKAGRYVEAQEAAARAFDVWNKSGLGGEGTALRVRAEALEALGRRDAAIAVVEDAIGALQPLQQVNHLLATYKCAHRLTGKPEYLERAKYLQGALQRVDRSPPSSRLTPRERQIAQLVSEGSSNKAIAVLLGLSHRTVENHVAAIFGRLGIRARWQLTPDVLRAMPGNGVAGASYGHDS